MAYSDDDWYNFRDWNPSPKILDSDRDSEPERKRKLVSHSY